MAGHYCIVALGKCVCLKENDSDVAHYNFNVHQPILVVFGINVVDRVCYEMVICYPTSPK